MRHVWASGITTREAAKLEIRRDLERGRLTFEDAARIEEYQSVGGKCYRVTIIN